MDELHKKHEYFVSFDAIDSKTLKVSIPSNVFKNTEESVITFTYNDDTLDIYNDEDSITYNIADMREIVPYIYKKVFSIMAVLDMDISLTENLYDSFKVLDKLDANHAEEQLKLLIAIYQKDKQAFLK